MSRVVMIETEAGRGEAYADDAEVGGYNVISLRESFSPKDYGEAITEAESSGAEVLIIDSASHEWEGVGGVLAATVGLREAFVIAALVYLLAVLFVVFGYDESIVARVPAEVRERASFAVLRRVPAFLMLTVMVFGLQLVDRSFGPVLPLYLGEIGTASAGINVAHNRRTKMKMTRITSPMVSASVNSTSLTAARMELARSLRVSSDAAAGNSPWNDGSIALTASTTATVLASGWRCTARMMAREPSYQLAV